VEDDDEIRNYLKNELSVYFRVEEKIMEKRLGRLFGTIIPILSSAIS